MALNPLKAKMVLENQFGEVSINYMLPIDGVPGVETEFSEEGDITGAAFQATATVASGFGSDDFAEPSSAYGLRGYVNGDDLAQTQSFNAGTVGYYGVTGTNASLMPKCGVLGIIGDTTTTADAAVMAYLDGDGGATNARAGFGIMMLNSTAASGFDYGMDLKLQVQAGHESFSQAYKKADARYSNDVVFMSGAGAPVDGTTGDNFAGPGSIYINITTGKMYLQGSLITTPVWKLVTSAA